MRICKCKHFINICLFVLEVDAYLEKEYVVEVNMPICIHLSRYCQSHRPGIAHSYLQLTQ